LTRGPLSAGETAVALSRLAAPGDSEHRPDLHGPRGDRRQLVRPRLHGERARIALLRSARLNLDTGFQGTDMAVKRFFTIVYRPNR